MTDPIKDQVSALLDDELEEREASMLLARFGKDDSLRATWERYSLIGECIRGNLPDHIAAGLAGRVASELERNAPLKAKPARISRAVWRPVAGLAVAASVAAIALISFGNMDRGLPVGPTPLAATAEDEAYTVPVVNLREQASASLRERLNLYQVSHSEFASPMQRRSLISQMATDESFEGLDTPVPESADRE